MASRPSIHWVFLRTGLLHIPFAKRTTAGSAGGGFDFPRLWQLTEFPDSQADPGIRLADDFDLTHRHRRALVRVEARETSPFRRQLIVHEQLGLREKVDEAVGDRDLDCGGMGVGRPSGAPTIEMGAGGLPQAFTSHRAARRLGTGRGSHLSQSMGTPSIGPPPLALLLALASILRRHRRSCRFRSCPPLH